METEDVPAMIKTSLDAIPLEATGTIETIGEVKMDLTIPGEGEIGTQMTGRYQGNKGDRDMCNRKRSSSRPVCEEKDIKTKLLINCIK